MCRKKSLIIIFLILIFAFVIFLFLPTSNKISYNEKKFIFSDFEQMAVSDQIKCSESLCKYIESNRINFNSFKKKMKLPILHERFYIGYRMVNNYEKWDTKNVYFDLGNCKKGSCYEFDKLVMTISRDGFIISAEILEY